VTDIGDGRGMMRLGPRHLPAMASGLLALVLVALAFLPWGEWLGAGRVPDVTLYQAAVRRWLVWGGPLLVAAFLASLVLGARLDHLVESRLSSLAKVSVPAYGASLAAITAIIAALASVFAFDRNPHIIDTFAQLFHARIFAQGKLGAPAPQGIEFFIGQFLLQHDGRWFSQYPPGHPLILAAGLRVGLAWLVNPLAAAATVLLVYGAARRLLGENGGKLAALLFALSPFVLLMSGSYMNHVTALFFLTLALYASVRAQDGADGTRWVVLVGMAVGAAATIRPLEAVAWCIVLGAWIAHRQGWRRGLMYGGACALAVSPLLAYNTLTTGSPFRFAYTLLWGRGHGLGFHPDPWGEPFTPAMSLANTAIDFQRLNIDLFGWPLPCLVFVIVALLVAARDERERGVAAVLAALLVAAPAAYFFYWHHDSYLGPRFLYASVVPAVLLTSLGIGALDRRLGRWRSALRVCVAGCLLYGLAVTLPQNAGVVAGMERDFKLHPDAQARAAGIGEGIIFVKVGWGERLGGRLRGWDIPAADVKRSLRAVDGCRLQRALDEADSMAAMERDRAAIGEELRRRLVDWREQSLPVVKGRLPDASVGMDTTRSLSQGCHSEAAWDDSGFIRYEPFVWRNDPWLRGVIYARYLGPEINRRLLDRYPRRSAYIYAPPSREPGVEPVLFPHARPSTGARPETEAVRP
jgi:hypothetical protein